MPAQCFQSSYKNRYPQEKLPLILETGVSENYALIDSGNGQKLERYGDYRIIRPEGQALWKPALSQKQWADVDAIFTGNRDEEGIGRWHFPKSYLMKHGPFLGMDCLFWGVLLPFVM